MAGGHLSENDQYWSSSEIYNTETQEWREGPTLPHTIYASSSVQYDNTFLLVGGRNYSYQYLDTIYQYNQTSETWILRPERLSTPKGFMAAVLAGPPVAACGWRIWCSQRINDGSYVMTQEILVCFLDWLACRTLIHFKKGAWLREKCKHRWRRTRSYCWAWPKKLWSKYVKGE